jgi:hypothetical protein
VRLDGDQMTADPDDGDAGHVSAGVHIAEGTGAIRAAAGFAVSRFASAPPRRVSSLRAERVNIVWEKDARLKGSTEHLLHDDPGPNPAPDGVEIHWVGEGVDPSQGTRT